MELLSRRHGLRTLEIAFYCKSEVQSHLWQHFFRKPSKSPLVRELGKLRGVLEFHCDDEQIQKDVATRSGDIEWMEEALEVYKNLQEAMKPAKVPKNDEPLPSVPDCLSSDSSSSISRILDDGIIHAQNAVFTEAGTDPRIVSILRKQREITELQGTITSKHGQLHQLQVKVKRLMDLVQGEIATVA